MKFWSYALIGFTLFAGSITAEYTAKDYSYLIGNIEGYDDELLKMHFKLYQGYVTNANNLLKKLTALSEKGEAKSQEYAGLKRMLGWEFDGMLLHEIYFDNMGKTDLPPENSALMQKIKQDFGSFEAWKNDFIATGSIRGIGWAIAYIEPKEGRLINEWINEHNVGHLAGGSLLLAMDVFEHAYISQFGIDRGKYIDVFFNNINWNKVSERYEKVKKERNGQSK